MRTKNVIMYFAFLLSLVAVVGIINADVHTVASTLVAIACGIYCAIVGAVTIKRGLNR